MGCACAQVALLTEHLVRVLRVASSLQVLDAGSFAVQVPPQRAPLYLYCPDSNTLYSQGENLALVTPAKHMASANANDAFQQLKSCLIPPQEIFSHYGNEDSDGAPSERNTLFQSLSKEVQVRRCHHYYCTRRAGHGLWILVWDEQCMTDASELCIGSPQRMRIN